MTRMHIADVGCSLDGPELGDRLEQWRNVTARATSRMLDGNTAVASYPNEVTLLRELRRLIDAEKECCPFMRFEIEEAAAEITVRLSVPDGMDDVLPRLVGAAAPR